MEPVPGRYGIEDEIERASTLWAHLRARLRLRPDRCEVTFDGTGLRFRNYCFKPARVFPEGQVHRDDVAEVNVANVSQVRLTSSEILFVPHASQPALLSFVQALDVPVRRRASLWSDLLDPFVDTWWEQSVIDRQFERLANAGLERATVDAWRREVAAAMVAYNSILWEWTSLDLYDVLRAQQAQLSSVNFASFYHRAMALASRDPVLPD